MERISVIIAVYNTEKYLEKSVRSVMGQTYRDLNIICVNDGSTDGSLDILRRLQKEDSRIVIVDKPNGGMGDARNAGLKMADSEWIAFVDSDDFIEPDAFEKVSHAFGANPDMIHFGTSVVQEEGFTYRSTNKKYFDIRFSGLVEIDGDIIMKSDVVIWNKFFRRSILDRYDIHFEDIYYEDFAFTLQYMFSIRTVYYIEDRLYNYVRHPESVMGRTYARSARTINHMSAMRHVLTYLEQRGMVNEKNERALANLFAKSYKFTVQFVLPEQLPEVVSLSDALYHEYPFMQKYVVPTKENGNVIYRPKEKRRLVSRLLNKVFSLKPEFMEHCQIYKVMRIFGIVVFRKKRI